MHPAQTTTMPELAATVSKLRLKLQSLPFEQIQGKTKNVHQARQIRKEIARALTKIHQISYQHAKNF